MGGGKHRRNWRIILDGRTEVARRRANTAEQAIAWFAAQSGCPADRLTAEDLGNDAELRQQRTQGATLEFRDGKWGISLRGDDK